MATANLTATGQILGTPSYMPPEQALGKSSEVDRRSDVYALGAILYAALSGHPPHQAAHPMDTIKAVVELEPVALRAFNAGIPKDLETICLKALSKEKERRYDTRNGFGGGPGTLPRQPTDRGAPRRTDRESSLVVQAESENCLDRRNPVCRAVRLAVWRLGDGDPKARPRR